MRRKRIWGVGFGELGEIQESCFGYDRLEIPIRSKWKNFLKDPSGDAEECVEHKF